MFNNINQVTKTNKTKEEYLRRAKNRIKKCLGNRAKEFYGQDEIVVEIMEFMKKERKDKMYEQNTWRKQRAEMKHYAEVNGYQNMVQAINKLPRQKIENPKRKKAKIRTKYKFIPEKIYDEIKRECLKKTTSFATTIINWIDATIITGIRPMEWISVKMATQKTTNNGTEYPVLRIKNAKNTNGRTFGEYRHIVLTDINPHDMKAILHMVEIVKQIRQNNKPEAWEKAWKRVYNQHRKALYKINLKIRPTAKKVVTIYSARHQFTADCKANEVSEFEIAALMGHGSIDTHAKHYGKKHLGSKGSFRVNAPKQNIKKLKTASNLKAVKRKEQKLDYTKIRVNKAAAQRQDNKNMEQI